MIQGLFTTDVQAFIRQHESDDVSSLMLSYDTVHGVPARVVADQIIGRRKAKEKLPTYYNTHNIIYPRGLNLEQSSSEQTGRLKSDLLSSMIEHRASCLDLTGGFGVDCLSFSKVFNQVFYIEPDETLLNIARHNHRQLGAHRISYINARAEDFLSSTDLFFDLVYIDPSRRISGGRKVSTLRECEPDVTILQPAIFKKTNYLLIKASPLLDIQQGMRNLVFVKQVFVVAVDNECKELLFWCENGFEGEAEISAINISNGDSIDRFTFKVSEERLLTIEYSVPLRYLYEPNAAILKAGAFKTIAERLKIKKVHPHTHLYTSDVIHSNFPGRVFEVVALVKPVPKSLKAFFPNGKANVTTRNYPLTVKQLRDRTGLLDGGDDYLIGFSGIEKKYVAAAVRVL